MSAPQSGDTIGGGGGAVGRVYIRTRDGSVMDEGALISAVEMTGMLVVQ
jgi:hypothetical protein